MTKQYVRGDKLTRPAGIGLPGDLLAWVEEQARQEGIPKSRFVTQVLEAERKRRQLGGQMENSDLTDLIDRLATALDATNEAMMDLQDLLPRLRR